MSPSRGFYLIHTTLTPFLYPRICTSSRHITLASRRALSTSTRYLQQNTPASDLEDDTETSISGPAAPFADSCTVTFISGSGGNGCVSFLREKYIAFGPANGGDGGHGGSVYIRAVDGATSLHKLARRGQLKGGQGRNGEGKTKNGAKGEDIIVEVPVGTIVREIERVDLDARKRKNEGWLYYPGEVHKGERREGNAVPDEEPDRRMSSMKRQRADMMQPMGPIILDLSTPTESPILLAAGAPGGLGNPHFVSTQVPRPKVATRGGHGMRITMQLELKILADVGLVGMANAGKSTLIRALTKSKARVGHWAFTTLQPNVGTVVLDNFKGRSRWTTTKGLEHRTRFTIADIPGLIKDAHLDRGMGISFLRHIERAKILSFVVDLNGPGGAVEGLKALWRELTAYEQLKEDEARERDGPRESDREGVAEWKPISSLRNSDNNGTILELEAPRFRAYSPDSISAGSKISTKPWLVVATKADLPETQDKFLALKSYLDDVAAGRSEHPGGPNAWKGRIEVIPVSAMRGEGVDRIVDAVVGLLDFGQKGTNEPKRSTVGSQFHQNASRVLEAYA